VKQTCTQCGRTGDKGTDIVKHHPNYKHPYRTILLCRKCHSIEHKEIASVYQVIKQRITDKLSNGDLDVQDLYDVIDGFSDRHHNPRRTTRIYPNILLNDREEQSLSSACL
jgi:hypothetical protein